MHVFRATHTHAHARKCTHEYSHIETAAELSFDGCVVRAHVEPTDTQRITRHVLALSCRGRCSILWYIYRHNLRSVENESIRPVCVMCVCSYYMYASAQLRDARLNTVHLTVRTYYDDVKSRRPAAL